MMDFRMETFLTVCRYMNFTKAASELHITQPAVSQHIHYLETFYEEKLFLYQGKKMLLSKAGEMLYHSAVTMKHDQLYLSQKIKQNSQKDVIVNFGATLTIGEFVMPKHLTNYLFLNPDANVKMILGNTSELLNKLALGEIDFAVVEGYFNQNDYEFLIYSNERYIPVCGKNYRFKNEPGILEELTTECLIIREKGSGTREILEKNLEEKNKNISSFKRVVEIGSMSAIKALVESNCGITFLYEAAVRKELDIGSIREIKLEDFQVTHDFTFIWNKGSIFSDSYLEICSLFKGETLNKI